MTTKPLSILVTRPKPGGDQWCAALRKKGFNVIYFPTLDMVPVKESEALQERIEKINQVDWLIFISPQAVYHAVDHMTLPLKSSVKIAAVGKGTERALIENNIAVDLTPAEEWSSEGLLKCSAFQNVTGKKILLVKGEGGRTLLADTLIERGAVVEELVVYARVLPSVNPEPLRDCLRQHKIDIILCTSAECLNNLVELVGEHLRKKLTTLPLVVVSDRLKKVAETLQFREIMTANNAHLESIMEVIPMTTEQDNSTSAQKPTKLKMNFAVLLSLGILVVVIALSFIFEQQLIELKNELQSSGVRTALKTVQDKVLSLEQVLHQHQANEHVNEALYTQLVELGKAIASLPIKSKPLISDEATPSEDLSTLSWWQRGLHQSWLQLKKIIVVRHHTDSDLLFVFPEEKKFLYLSCEAKLEAAMWGLLHHQPFIYQSSLSSLSDSIQRYFDEKAAAPILSTLATLQKENVQPNQGKSA